MPSKGIIRAALERAFAEEGCPICRLLLAREENWLRAVLTESINDLGMRDRLAASWGFCHRHAWSMATRTDLGGPLGIAIIYESLAGRLLKECGMDTGDGDNHHHLAIGREEYLDQVRPGYSCVSCTAWAELEQNYTVSFARYYTQERFAALYLSSQGLCLKHLEQALSILRPSARSFLLRAALAKLERERRAALGAHDRAYGVRDPLAAIRPRLNLLAGPYPFCLRSGDYYRYGAALGRWAGSRTSRHKSRCVLCGVEREVEKQEFARLLGSERSAQQDDTRLCSVHAWQLHSLAVESRRFEACASWSARLASSVMGSIENLLYPERPIPRNEPLLARLRPPRAIAPLVSRECAVCGAQAKASRSVASEIAQSVAKGAQGAGEANVCLTHFALLVEVAPPSVASLLRRGQLGKLRKLWAGLHSYVH